MDPGVIDPVLLKGDRSLSGELKGIPYVTRTFRFLNMTSNSFAAASSSLIGRERTLK